MSESYFTVSHISRKDLARIFSKIKVSNSRFYNGSPCWEWTASKVQGYGNIRWDGKVRRAHRVLYAWIYGPIPHKGHNQEIDHLCRNTGCVNPCHLELVTCQVNALRGTGMAARNIQKTHCPRGHEYAPENTLPCKDGKGRKCKQCKAEWHKNKMANDPEYAAQYREKGRQAMRNRRAKLCDDPNYKEQCRRHNRRFYHKAKQNPEWVKAERERLRALYHRQREEAKRSTD